MELQSHRVALTHGPILSTSPNCDEMYVFVRAIQYVNGEARSARVKVRYKQIDEERIEYSEPADTNPDKDYTAILRVPVSSSKRYEYVIVNDNTDKPMTKKFEFTSMPSRTGPFVLYHLSDSHGANSEWPLNVIEHHDQQYPEIPYAVLYTGDIFCLPANESVNDIELIYDHYKTLYGGSAFRKLFSQAPLYQIWDDWDFMSDNSCRSHGGARGLYEIDRSIAISARKSYVPNPYSFHEYDDARFHLYIAEKNLIVVPDSRSHKNPISISSEDTCVEILNGSQSELSAPCWGRDQLNWVKSLFDMYSKTRQSFIVSTQSFIDNVDSVTAFPCDGALIGSRDSFGIFHKGERNAFLSHIQGLIEKGALTKPPFILSGDDHKPKITYRNFWHSPYNVKEDEPDVSGKLTIGLYEMKAGNGGLTTTIFDNPLHPPYWYAGCDDQLATPPTKGYGHSKNKDIGFVFHITPINHMTKVQAVLFEDETPCEGHLARSAPHIIFEEEM